MKLLLDTHLLIWAAAGDARFPPAAKALLIDPENDVAFSVVSIWEAAIKFGLNRADFPLHPASLRNCLLAAGYQELQVTGQHALAAADLPLLHRDPFDRLLLAQAAFEGFTLLTSNSTLAGYRGPVRLA